VWVVTGRQTDLISEFMQSASNPRAFEFQGMVFGVRSWGSLVSIVSDYGLDDWVIGVRSLAGAKDFSSNLFVQTGSEAHPASCTMGTGRVLSPGQSSAGA
jgi:hypothetical protein